MIQKFKKITSTDSIRVHTVISRWKTNQIKTENEYSLYIGKNKNYFRKLNSIS